MLYYPHTVRIRPQDLHGQFLLTRTDAALPQGWRAEGHGSWQLRHSHPLPCIRILGARGELTGWLLGHVITEDGLLLTEGRTFHHDPATRDFGALVDGLNGRFIAIDLSTTAPSVYLDGQGSLAAVYSEAAASVASTSGLIPLSEETGFELDRILDSDIPYAAAHYPFGLTPRRGVNRLLPNHVLRVDGWRMERRWPHGPFAESVAPDTAVNLVRRAVPMAMRAIRAEYPLSVTLTAGRDSRMMLACARACMPGSVLWTADLGDRTAWRDVALARAVGKKFGIPHLSPSALSWPGDLSRWVARTGGEAGEPRGWRATRALARQPAGYATITGAAADLSKLIGWRKKFLTRSISPRDLLDYCHVPRRAEFIRQVERWLAGLPPLSSFEIAELAQVEQSQAAWGGVIEYGELGRSAMRLSPMTSAGLVRSALGLPVDYRIAMRLHEDVIAAEWPELLEFPYEERVPVPTARSGAFMARHLIRTRIGRGTDWARNVSVRAAAAVSALLPWSW